MVKKNMRKKNNLKIKIIMKIEKINIKKSHPSQKVKAKVKNFKCFHNYQHIQKNCGKRHK